MFKDYYKILEISSQASLKDIKEAYLLVSKKWHPDLNQGVDTTQMMQDINEAYAILKDEIKRKRYDAEYMLFNEKRNYNRTTQAQSTNNTWSYDYDVKDENLKEDIKSARRYAKDLVDEFLSSLKENSKTAAEAAWEGVKKDVYFVIIVSIISLFLAICLM